MACGHRLRALGGRGGGSGGGDDGDSGADRARGTNRNKQTAHERRHIQAERQRGRETVAKGRSNGALERRGNRERQRDSVTER